MLFRVVLWLRIFEKHSRAVSLDVQPFSKGHAQGASAISDASWMRPYLSTAAELLKPL